MEQVLAQAKVKITPASKIWDAQRAYKKRLTTTMSKDKGNYIPSSSEDVFGQMTSCQHVESEPEPQALKKSRPQPKRKSRRLTP